VAVVAVAVRVEVGAEVGAAAVAVVDWISS